MVVVRARVRVRVRVRVGVRVCGSVPLEAIDDAQESLRRLVVGHVLHGLGVGSGLGAGAGAGVGLGSELG